MTYEPINTEDRQTRRQGDKETARAFSPCLLVSLSPCLFVSLVLSSLWVLGAFGVSSCHAQSLGPDGVYYSRQSSFRIPFQTEPGERRIRQVQLYVSEDHGHNWRQV